MSSTFTNLIYHLVFSTKHRIAMIDAKIQCDLYAYISGIIENKKCLPLEIGGIEDHVHIVVRTRASMRIADLVRTIKSNSSKWLNERPDICAPFAWQVGYGAFTISTSQLSRVRLYVRRQQEHHQKGSFQDEMLRILKQNQIPYDPATLWD